MTMLSPHFSIEEFTASDTAVRLSIDNTIPASLLVAAQETAQLLERIRDELSRQAGQPVPILVSSGYRCLPLNRALLSDDSSDHVIAAAADFKAPAFGTPYQVSLALSGLVDELGIGQLIHEFGRWIHVSTRRPGKQINRVITISKRGTEVGIQEV